MGRRANACHDWLAPALAAVVSLSALLGDPGEAATLVVLAVATCFGWSAVARALLASRRVGESRRTSLLRLVCVAQGASVALVWGLLMMRGHLLPAVAVLIVGAALSALVWPWPWRLTQAADDRGRLRDTQLAQQHLLAAGILLVLAAGSAIALSGVACAMLMALCASSVVDAWDEWRRPRAVPERGSVADSGLVPADRPADEATALETVTSPTAAPSREPHILRADEVAAPGVSPEGTRLPAQRDAEPTERPGRAAHRRDRRRQPRYSGRRVADRRS